MGEEIALPLCSEGVSAHTGQANLSSQVGYFRKIVCRSYRVRGVAVRFKSLFRRVASDTFQSLPKPYRHLRLPP
jgi:hypothetical protein